jgi:pimeloyl-ACP methyl ester carboxylesterase
MRTLIGANGVRISYSVEGSGPPLVLVHGSFSDHETNWTFAGPLLKERFTTYGVARRGRGATDATIGHRLEDEAQDVAEIVRAIGEPVYLLGHSYGGHCALLAAAAEPARVRKLVLYEPVWPHAITPDALAALDTLAAAGAWDQFAFAFFANSLHVPTAELESVRASALWPPIVADAPASRGDLRALSAYRFDRTLTRNPARMTERLSISGARGSGEYERRQRLYREDELRAAVNRAGFAVRSVFADAGGAAFEPAASATMWVIGERT